MKKSEGFVHTLELSLQTSMSDQKALDKYFELSRNLYNTLLREALKRLNLMRQSKKYSLAKTKDKKVKSKMINELKEEFGFTMFDMIKFGTTLRVNEFRGVDSCTTQKLSNRAFMATEKILYGKAKKVNFKSKGDMRSIEGSTNKQGIKYRDGCLKWNKLKLKVNIRDNDYYAKEALSNRIKYCGIIWKNIRGKKKYFIQLIIDGMPPGKVDIRTGKYKGRYGNGKVGIDIGTQTIAIASDKEVKLLELAPEVVNIEKEKRVLLRKMDRSRRESNPNKFNENGTIKKGNNQKWVFSKNYLKIRSQLSDLQRKQTEVRKQSHYRLVNWMVGLGDEFYVEKMNYKGLQAKSKETKVNEKTGRFCKKKRFGKSLANKAPSTFLMILEKKLSYWYLELNKIDTTSFKASQYNHFKDDYEKKKLSDRWNEFECGKIQRDLYSAFLIMNSRNNLKSTDRDLCFKTWDNFKDLHDIEIKRLENEEKLLASMGIK
ncbi:RNA-guided endonuclease TnpB family protein [Priestia megaterium]|uniref:RNA-guided endonuclease TnpB family protein n=1 Tax=Priestia megaterium TaxID=1404 RepID=UPI003CC615D2